MTLDKFAEQAVSDFKKKAVQRRSSRFLAQDMARRLPLEGAKYVVELGPGTGVITQEILDVMPSDGRLLAFEISPQLSLNLKHRLRDHRLEVINSCAASAGDELRRRGWTRLDVAVASLGFGFMPDDKAHEIFSNLTPFLDENSVFSLFQYAHRMKLLDGQLSLFDVGDLLDQHFRKIERRMFWRNLPPAFVFKCRM